MPPPLIIPDLVRLSQLQAQFLFNTTLNIKYTQHIELVAQSSSERRKVRKEEQWVKQRKLGEGGFGAVYLQKCIKGDKQDQLRAVKRIKKQGYANYHRELEAIALFSQLKYEQCFVRSYGWYDNDDYIYIAMEYLPNGDLSNCIKEPLPENECKLIVAQLLEGLSFMHEHGFAHRDLKPQNVLVVHKPPRRWWVKLADFGISKRAADGQSELRTKAGTPAYAAPEVFGIIQTDSYTSAVDMWSLGVIAYRVLTGETMFRDAIFRDPSRLIKYVGGTLKFPVEALQTKEISPEGCQAIEKMIAAKPENRPSAAECLNETWLLGVMESSPVEESRDVVSVLSEETIGPSSSGETEITYDSEPSARWTTISPPLSKTTFVSELEPSARWTTIAPGDMNAIVGKPSARNATTNSQPQPQPKRVSIAGSSRQLADRIKSAQITQAGRSVSPSAPQLPPRDVASTEMLSTLPMYMYDRVQDREGLQPGTKLVPNRPPNPSMEERDRGNAPKARDRHHRDPSDPKLRTQNQPAPFSQRAAQDENNFPNRYGRIKSDMRPLPLQGQIVPPSSSYQPAYDSSERGQALRLARVHGNKDIIAILEGQDIDPNSAADDYFGNILQEAVSYGNTFIVKTLLEKGADVNAEGGHYGTSLQASLVCDNPEVISLIMSYNPNVHSQSGKKYGNCLTAAASRGNLQAVTILLSLGCDPNLGAGDYGNPLHAAAYAGSSEVVYALLMHNADVNVRGGVYGTPLQAAAAKGHEQIVNILLGSGADPSLQGGEYGSALNAARQFGHSNIEKLLVENGALRGAIGKSRSPAPSLGKRLDVSDVDTDHDSEDELSHMGYDERLAEVERRMSRKYGAGTNFLVLAALQGSIDDVKFLIKNSAFDLDDKFLAHGTPLTAACKQGHLEMVKLLVQKGADVNRCGGEYCTPLQAAAHKGHLDIVQYLLSHHAIVDAYGGLYCTALQAAVMGRHKEICRVLIENHADVNVGRGGLDRTALKAALFVGDDEITQMLKDAGASLTQRDIEDLPEIDVNDIDGFVKAVTKGDHFTFSRYVSKGVDLDGVSSKRTTALQSAARNGHIFILADLLQAGADVDIQYGNEGTALIAAANRNHKDCVELLLDFGADPHIESPKYGSAVAAAQRRGHTEIATMINRHIQKLNENRKRELHNAQVHEDHQRLLFNVKMANAAQITENARKQLQENMEKAAEKQKKQTELEDALDYARANVAKQKAMFQTAQQTEGNAVGKYPTIPRLAGGVRPESLTDFWASASPKQHGYTYVRNASVASGSGDRTEGRSLSFRELQQRLSSRGDTRGDVRGDPGGGVRGDPGGDIRGDPGGDARRDGGDRQTGNARSAGDDSRDTIVPASVSKTADSVIARRFYRGLRLQSKSPTNPYRMPRAGEGLITYPEYRSKNQFNVPHRAALPVVTGTDSLPAAAAASSRAGQRPRDTSSQEFLDTLSSFEPFKVSQTDDTQQSQEEMPRLGEQIPSRPQARWKRHWDTENDSFYYVDTDGGRSQSEYHVEPESQTDDTQQPEAEVPRPEKEVAAESQTRWVKHWDSNSGCYFFVNSATGRS